MTPPADPFSKPLLRTVIMTGVPALGAGLAAWAASVEAVSIEIVGSARTADEAANLAGLHAVDLVIVCADLEPQRVLDRMRLRLPETAVLVLVGAEDQEAEARAFRAGASAAIPSSATEETFGCALRSLAHGRATLSIQVLRTLATPRDDAELTQRQRQIRELLDWE